MHNPYQGKASLVLRELVPRAAYEAERGAMKSGDAKRAAGEVTPEDALDEIFGAVDGGVVDGVAMVSVPSTANLGKLDVIHLQEALELRCEASNARPFGVCPTREGLYGDCFDELIRQSTCLCPERGLLLAELRDEVFETQRTYDMLFHSACQYGARKAIERDLKRTMQAELADLTKEAQILENRVNEMRAKYEGMQKRHQERRAAEHAKHELEKEFLKKGNQQLTNEIKRLSVT